MPPALAFSVGNAFFRNQTGGVARLTANPGSLVSGLLPNVMVIAGVVFFAYMLWGGWDMVLGAGRGGNPPDVQKAWNKITYGLMGFLIVVSSFFILQIVSTVTGINFISPNI